MNDTVFSHQTQQHSAVTETTLLDDRQRFWHGFNRFTVGGILGVVAVLMVVLYAIL